MKVLVTRPEGQHEQLQQQLLDAGYESRHFPLLAIEPVEIDAIDRQTVLNLEKFSGIIVISPNAARYGLDLIDQYWPQLPIDQLWITNGTGTKEILEQHYIQAIIPKTGTSSEDLINLPQLDKIKDQSWLIIRGQGGRELLSHTLKERGAQVSYLEVYQRGCPDYSEKDTLGYVNWCDAILISSAQALENLTSLTDDAVLFNKTVIVSSSRLMHIAKKLGWRKPVLAAGANNRQMIDALQNLI